MILLPAALFYIKSEWCYLGVIALAGLLNIIKDLSCCKKRTNYNSDTPFKQQLQRDIDSKNKKPKYSIELRYASSLALLIACFVHSTTFPFLLPFGMVYITLSYFKEVSVVSK